MEFKFSFFNFLESENSIKAEENRVENRKPKRFLVVIDQQDLGYILIGVMFHAMRALYKATTYTQYTPLPPGLPLGSFHGL